MTGRELIIYILENHLEDEPVVRDGHFTIGFLSLDEAAVKTGVGLDTVIAWAVLNGIPRIKIDGKIYIPANFEQYLNKEGSDHV